MLKICVRALALFALMSASACASSGTTSNRGNDLDILTREDFGSMAASSAYDVVSRLRPNWLRQPMPSSISRGQVSTQAVGIYVDGVRYGGVEVLRSMGVSGIASIQYLTATRAAIVLREASPDAVAGAILVTTLK